MGRRATINKFDVINARDTLRAAGKPHGIIAIRKHLGRGSPGLISRLLGDDTRASVSGSGGKNALNPRPGPRPTAENAVKALALREQEIIELRQTVRRLEQRVALAEAKSASATAAMTATEREIVRQREMFERWRADLLRDRNVPANPLGQVTVTISPPSPTNSTVGSNSGEQLDLYAGDYDTA